MTPNPTAQRLLRDTAAGWAVAILAVMVTDAAIEVAVITLAASHLRDGFVVRNVGANCGII